MILFFIKGKMPDMKDKKKKRVGHKRQPKGRHLKPTNNVEEQHQVHKVIKDSKKVKEKDVFDKY